MLSSGMVQMGTLLRQGVPMSHTRPGMEREGRWTKRRGYLEARRRNLGKCGIQRDVSAIGAMKGQDAEDREGCDRQAQQPARRDAVRTLLLSLMMMQGSEYMLPNHSRYSKVALADEVVQTGGEQIEMKKLTEIGGEEGRNDLSEVKFKHMEEPVLAYAFDYPVTTTSGKPLNLIASRKPERYSSAAPLTADARQRIVFELVNLANAVTISVSVGPPAGTLRSTKVEDWTARQIAEQVLVDRSTGRVTSGQRVSLSSVENAGFVEKGGHRYCVYEHVSQGSPTLMNSSRETYRHSKAVTVLRLGLENEPFLYTLNVSCPQDDWEDLKDAFQATVDSFVLTEPGPEYVAPNQDPWRFF